MNRSRQTDKERERIDDTEAFSLLWRHLTAISSPLRSRLAKNFIVHSMSEQENLVSPLVMSLKDCNSLLLVGSTGSIHLIKV